MSTLTVTAEKYVFNLLNKELDAVYVYHNITHTQDVFAYTAELAKNLNIDAISKENLQLAALFHDTGFIKGA